MKNRLVVFCFFMCGVYLSSFAQVVSYTFDSSKANEVLARQMDSIWSEDQQHRVQLMKLSRGGATQQALDSVRQIIREKDRSNLAFVEQLIGRYGWLTPQDVGVQGAQTLFLIIQHADLATQKKYYPLIRNAEQEGNALSSNVALLEDRIAVREGRSQTYGSQGYYDPQKKRTVLYPLTDPNRLNELRSSRGLDPINDWNIRDYESYLPYATELLNHEKETN